MNKQFIVFAFALAFLFIPVPSFADTLSDTTDNETNTVTDSTDPHVQHDLSFTFSPLHLGSVTSLLEVTGEYRLADKVGVAAILGIGSVTVTDESTFAFELGTQFRYYLLGSFIHGLQVGAEALYFHISDVEIASGVGSGGGFFIGPFLGYKIATNIGFTFDAQFGFQTGFLQAEASYNDGTVSANSSSSKRSVLLPLLNLNVGWSF